VADGFGESLGAHRERESQAQEGRVRAQHLGWYASEGKKVKRASAPFCVNARSGSTDSRSEQHSEVEGSSSSAAVSVGLSRDLVSPGPKRHINTSHEYPASRGGALPAYAERVFFADAVILRRGGAVERRVSAGLVEWS